MFQRILVPLDGSPGAERAIPVAARIAHNANGSIVLLHVISPASALKSVATGSHAKKLTESAIEQVIADTADYLAAMLTIYAEDLAGITTEMNITFGTASPALSSTARLEQVDLIVMCRHREVGLGQWGFEGVAQQLMRHSPAPLLLLSDHETGVLIPDLTHPLRLLVPLDGSLFAETALEPALQMLSQFVGPGQGELCLIRVVDLLEAGEEAHMSAYTEAQARYEAKRYLQAIADRISKKPDLVRPLHITCMVATSVDIASAILKQTDEAYASEKTGSYPLIALATHGREGLELVALGSVAEQILDKTTHPLLIVCPPETDLKPVKHVSLTQRSFRPV